MATKVADVAVRVGADIGPLQSGMKRGSRSVDDFGRRAQQTAKRVAMITTAVTAAATVIGVKMVKDTLAAVDAQAKLARQLDGTIDGLRSVQIAGKDAGIESGVLSGAMERLTTRLGEAQQGTGQAAKALRELGLDAEKLAAMDIDDRMAALADRMQEMGLSAAQAGNYLRDLGIRNGQIINLMRQGGDAIRDARVELQQFGLSISEIDAAKIERANDAMERIGWAAESVKQALTVELSGVIEEVAKTLSESFKESGADMREGIGGAVDFGVTKFAQLLRGAATVAEFVEQNAELAQYGLLGYLVYGKKGALIGAGVGAVFAELKEGAKVFGFNIEENEQAFERMLRLTQEIGETQRVLAMIEQEVADQKERGEEATRGQLYDLEQIPKILEELERLHTEIRDDLTEQGVLQDFINEGLEEQETTTRNIAGLMREVADAMERGLQNDESGLLPSTEEIEDQATEINEVIDEMHRGQLAAYRMYYNARVDAAQEAADAEAEIASEQRATMLREASTGFGRLAALMETNHKGMFEVGKAAAISQTVIDTYAAAQASFKALAGIPIIGPGLGAAAAAAAVVGGLARVRAIGSRQMSTAGAGGDPGAGASIGSTSSRAGAAQQQEQQSRQNVNLSLVGDTFTRPSVLELIGEINEAIDNGAVIRVV